MAATAAHEATKTHFCKSPSCPNEASSPVGLHAYCKPCQAKRLPASTIAKAKASSNGDSHVDRLKSAMAAAKRLDQAEAKAREAGRELAAARTAHKDALIAMTAPHSVRVEAD